MRMSQITNHKFVFVNHKHKNRCDIAPLTQTQTQTHKHKCVFAFKNTTLILGMLKYLLSSNQLPWEPHWDAPPLVSLPPAAARPHPPPSTTPPIIANGLVIWVEVGGASAVPASLSEGARWRCHHHRRCGMSSIDYFPPCLSSPSSPGRCDDDRDDRVAGEGDGDPLRWCASVLRRRPSQEVYFR